MSPSSTAGLDPAHYESIYAAAGGDSSQIKWSDGRPHPALVTWMNAVAPSIIRCGARVCVIGCGLGEDAREVMRRGYDVTAFDCSPTAVAWAQRLDPQNAGSYHVADLFDPPSKWRHRFDLVIEINTVQALEPARRSETVAAIAEFVAPHGALLVICRHAATDDLAAAGPPWPLSENALIGSLPSELGNLKSLRTLRVDGNMLTGTVPPEFANMEELCEFSSPRDRFVSSSLKQQRPSRAQWPLA